MENVVLTQLTIPEVRQIFRQELANFFSTTHIHTAPTEDNSDKWLDIDEFCSYDPEKRSKATVYGMTSAGTIPFHKRGKKIYFLKSEIDTWLKSGRRKTIAEIGASASEYISSKLQKKR